MTTCSKCGAALPESAQYCMRCGTPAEIPILPEPIPVSAFGQPAFVAGATLGILSSLPIISLGNWFCCMWVLGGGALGSWLLDRQQPHGRGAISYGDGAFVGVLSGAFGALVATIISIPVRLLSTEALRSQLEAVEDMLAEIESPFRELVMQLLSPELSFIAILATFFVNLVTFSLFAMVGGILFVAIMGRKPHPGSQGTNSSP